MEKTLNCTIDGTENGNILHKSYNLINGARQQDYGKPWDNFGLLAEFFTSYSRKRWGVDIRFERTDVVNFLQLLKLSRACTATPTEDTYVDIAGYAGLAGDFAQRQRDEKTARLEDVQAAVAEFHHKLDKARAAHRERMAKLDEATDVPPVRVPSRHDWGACEEGL